MLIPVRSAASVRDRPRQGPVAPAIIIDRQPAPLLDRSEHGGEGVDYHADQATYHRSVDPDELKVASYL